MGHFDDNVAPVENAYYTRAIETVRIENRSTRGGLRIRVSVDSLNHAIIELGHSTRIETNAEGLSKLIPAFENAIEELRIIENLNDQTYFKDMADVGVYEKFQRDGCENPQRLMALSVFYKASFDSFSQNEKLYHDFVGEE